MSTKAVPLVVALTGSMGSGKSTTSEYFAMLGWHVISADGLAREVVKAGLPAHQEIVARFGDHILAADGEIDRQILRRSISSKKSTTVQQDRVDLEAIVHPRVRSLYQERRDAILNQKLPIPGIIYDVPLFFEANLPRSEFNAVIVVTAPDSLREQRVIARTQLPLAEVRQLMALQMPQNHKAQQADFVIKNDGSRDGLASQVKDVHDKLLMHAKHKLGN